MSFRHYLEKEITEDKAFYRLPKKSIENDLFALKQIFDNLYDRNHSGNDYSPNVMKTAEILIKKVKKAVVKNPTEEEMKKLDESNTNKMSDFVRKLIDRKVKPEDYDDEVKRVEKLTGAKLWKWVPSQGGSDFINLKNYTDYFKRK